MNSTVLLVEFLDETLLVEGASVAYPALQSHFPFQEIDPMAHVHQKHRGCGLQCTRAVRRLSRDILSSSLADLLKVSCDDCRNLSYDALLSHPRIELDAIG